MVGAEDHIAPNPGGFSEVFQKCWEVEQMCHWKSSEHRDSRQISDTPASLAHSPSQRLLSSIWSLWPWVICRLLSWLYKLPEAHLTFGNFSASKLT